MINWKLFSNRLHKAAIYSYFKYFVNFTVANIFSRTKQLPWHCGIKSSINYETFIKCSFDFILLKKYCTRTTKQLHKCLNKNQKSWSFHVFVYKRFLLFELFNSVRFLQQEATIIKNQAKIKDYIHYCLKKAQCQFWVL